MSISIALATHNGATFLPEQLDSFLHQTRLPDELVIVDDHSQDNTFEICNQFKKNAPFKVHIHQNSTQQGLTKTFEKALQLATSNLVLFSDQDDYWLKNKIEIYERYFDQHQTCQLLFSNALLVSENLETLNKSYWDTCNFSPQDVNQFSQNAIHYLTIWCYSLGMTIGLRKENALNFLPFPYHIPKFTTYMYHDGYLPFAFETLFPGSVHVINEQLVLYRQHKDQKSGAKENFWNNQFRRVMQIVKPNKTKQEQVIFDEFHSKLRKFILSNQ